MVMFVSEIDAAIYSELFYISRRTARRDEIRFYPKLRWIGMFGFTLNVSFRLDEFEELSSRNSKLTEYVKQKDNKINRLQER